MHDAPATVLQQLILWQTQKTKPVTNLSHERFTPSPKIELTFRDSFDRPNIVAIMRSVSLLN